MILLPGKRPIVECLRAEQLLQPKDRLPVRGDRQPVAIMRSKAVRARPPISAGTSIS